MCFLPVKKDWGLEKPATQMRSEGGSPVDHTALSPRNGAVSPDHKSKQEKRLKTQPGRILAAVGTGPRLEHYCPQR
jgi:hypothetical protein